MKGKKPTREQRKFLSSIGYDTVAWLVQKDTPTMMQLVHRDTGEEKTVQK